jgi:surface antigen
MRKGLFSAVVLMVFALSAAGAEAQINPFKRTGFELTEADVALLRAAAEKLYRGEEAPVGRQEAWENSDSGNKGTVELVEIFSHGELPCRRLQHDITLATQSVYRFIVDRCKLPSGEWKVL